jgi:AraC-like DNA-binding protein
MSAFTGQGTFAVLEQIHAVRGFETAFYQASHLTLHLRPLPTQANALLFDLDENPLCLLACGTVAGRSLCHRVQGEIRHGFEQRLCAQLVPCLAGLMVIAVPVLVCGEHAATLQTCRVLQQTPKPKDVQRFADLLTSWGCKPDLGQLERDFASLPVVTRQQLDAIVKLLGIYAEHLGDLASRRILAERRGRPTPLAQALTFVRDHQNERIHLREVAERVNLSPFYFCKLFHKTMGMTFTDYLVRLRLERAKDMLLGRNTRVSDIAFAAGFGSIPHFNRAFKRYTGLTPTLYRNNHVGDKALPPSLAHS